MDRLKAAWEAFRYPGRAERRGFLRCKNRVYDWLAAIGEYEVSTHTVSLHCRVHAEVIEHLLKCP